MTRLTKFLHAVDAHSLVGIFSIICAIVGVLASVQQSDESSNERWAKDGGTKYAAKD